MFKFNCQLCNGKIICEDEVKDSIVICPHCNQEIIAKNNFLNKIKFLFPNKTVNIIKESFIICLIIGILSFLIIQLIPTKYEYKSEKIKLINSEMETYFNKRDKTRVDISKTKKEIKNLKDELSKLKISDYYKRQIILDKIKLKKQEQIKKENEQRSLFKNYILSNKREKSSKIIKTEKIDSILKKYKNYELVSVVEEIETVYPNFGNSQYHTGIKPNVRFNAIILIFKRKYKF